MSLIASVRSLTAFLRDVTTSTPWEPDRSTSITTAPRWACIPCEVAWAGDDVCWCCGEPGVAWESRKRAGWPKGPGDLP